MFSIGNYVNTNNLNNICIYHVTIYVRGVYSGLNFLVTLLMNNKKFTEL